MTRRVCDAWLLRIWQKHDLLLECVVALTCPADTDGFLCPILAVATATCLNNTRSVVVASISRLSASKEQCRLRKGLPAGLDAARVVISASI